MPRIISAADLLASESGSTQSLAVRSIPMSDAPVDAQGLLVCQLLAVSLERDTCCPEADCGAWEVRLRKLARLLQDKDPRSRFFLVPGCSVESLPCLRAAAKCGWPLFLQLCQGLVCLESEHLPHKAWCRVEQVFVGAVLHRPVYMFPEHLESCSSPAVAGAESWLLSDVAVEVSVAAPALGQVLPEDRALFEAMAKDLLPDGPHIGVTLTCYRL